VKLFNFLTAKAKQGSPAPRDSVVQDDYKDRYLVMTGTKVTLNDVVSYLQQAEQGETRYWFAFCDEMRARDAFLDAELSKAETMVAGARVDVLIVPACYRSRSKERTGEAARAAEVASYVQDVLLAPAVQLDRAVSALMDGFWKGLGALQVVVEPVASGERIVSLDSVPAQRFRWAYDSTELLVQTGKDWGALTPVEELEDALVVFTPEAHIPSPARRGALRRLVPFFGIRTNGPGWWSRDVELFGIPMMLGEHPPGDEKTAGYLKNLLANLGARGWAVGPTGTKVTPLDTPNRGSGQSPHEAILDWTARQISVEVLGATQTTDVQAGAGSKASASVHQDVVIGKAAARARRVAACLREQLVFPLVERRFGKDVALRHTPELAIQVEQKPAIGEWGQAMKVLVEAGFGASIPRSLVNELGYAPEPEEGEPTLEKPVVAVAPPGPVMGEDPEEPEDEEPTETEAHRASRQAAGASQPEAELVRLETWAAKQATGAGEELLAPYRELIDQAEKDGATLQQLYSRIIQRAGVPPEAPHLLDLLAAVQCEAVMRGWSRERRG